MKKTHIDVHAVKTDAYHIAKRDLKKTGNEEGGFRSRNLWLEIQRVAKKPNIYKSEREHKEDEWETDAIYKRSSEETKNIGAKFAGSGTNFIGKTCHQDGLQYAMI